VQLITNDFPIDDPNYLRPCVCERDVCSFNTTSDAQGRWEMEVPVKYDEMWVPRNMLMRVSKGGGPPMYNLFQPGGTNQGDLQLLSPIFHFLFALDAISAGADPDELAVMFGVAIGFAEMDYPQEYATIPGVTISAVGNDPPEQYPITYLSETGLPDPALTETSALGAYYFVVPDARYTVAPSIEVAGDKPGSSFVSGFYAACPRSTTGVAVIDPYYRP
jgi:hypothetical protein